MVEKDIKDLPLGRPLSFFDNFKYLTTERISIKDLSKIVVRLEVILDRGYGELSVTVVDHKITRLDTTIQDKEDV